MEVAIRLTKGRWEDNKMSLEDRMGECGLDLAVMG
jgi:hypothetical protein